LEFEAMLIIHGFEMYGKTDRVPGLFHVATQFLHLYWVPFLPIKSYLVREQAGKNPPERIPIAFCWRSAILAWWRMVLFFLGWLSAWLGAVSLFDHLAHHRRQPFQPETFFAGFLVIVCFGLLFFSYRNRWPRPARALELAALTGISPEALAYHMAHRLSDADVEQLRQLHENQVTYSSSP
jgi:hypothetical protein